MNYKLKKGLVFVCNHERTESWNLIAQRLKERTYNNYLIAIVYDDHARKILNVSYFDLIIDLNNIVEGDTLHYFSNINFNEISFKDRELKYKNHVFVKQKLICFMKNIEANLNKFESLNFVGEVSWAAEELIYIYSKTRNFNYLTFVPVRFVPRRWAVVNALSEEAFLKFDIINITYNDNNVSNINTSGIANKQAHPDYFYDGLNNLKLINRIKKFAFSNGFKPRIPQLFIRKLMFIFFNSFLELLKKRTIPNGKVCYLYAFQVQPEASIDYLAPEYINQSVLIDNIISNLLPDEFLMIKEHPGETILWDLRKKISFLLNSKIVFLKTKSSLIDNLSGISGAISVTGTIVGELAMQGLPTVSLKKMFFNKLDRSFYESSVPKALETLRSNRVNNDLNSLTMDNKEFLKYIQQNSFPGYSYHTKEFGFNDTQFINSASDLLYEMEL